MGTCSSIQRSALPETKEVTMTRHNTKLCSITTTESQKNKHGVVHRSIEGLYEIEIQDLRQQIDGVFPKALIDVCCIWDVETIVSNACKDSAHTQITRQSSLVQRPQAIIDNVYHVISCTVFNEWQSFPNNNNFVYRVCVVYPYGLPQVIQQLIVEYATFIYPINWSYHPPQKKISWSLKVPRVPKNLWERMNGEDNSDNDNENNMIHKSYQEEEEDHRAYKACYKYKCGNYLPKQPEECHLYDRFKRGPQSAEVEVLNNLIANDLQTLLKNHISVFSLESETGCLT